MGEEEVRSWLVRILKWFEVLVVGICGGRLDSLVGGLNWFQVVGGNVAEVVGRKGLESFERFEELLFFGETRGRNPKNNKAAREKPWGTRFFITPRSHISHTPSAERLAYKKQEHP